jgi:hypothetical protein
MEALFVDSSFGQLLVECSGVVSFCVDHVYGCMRTCVCGAHLTDNASPILWIRTHHVTLVCIIPKKSKFDFPYFMIIHSCPISKNINRNYIFLMLWNDCDTFNYNCMLVPKTSLWRRPDYWPKHARENIIKVIKLEYICWLCIHFTNLSNVRNKESIKMVKSILLYSSCVYSLVIPPHMTPTPANAICRRETQHCR